MRKKVVMQDIADYLNISKNSVSQALSGKDGVSEETRRRIIQTAEEMGYQYTRKSSIRQKQEVKTIGLIASEFAFSMKNFFGEIYLAIEREAKKQGMELLIQSITPDMRESLALPSFIRDKSVDGILILSHISTSYIQEVLAQNIATVMIDHHHPLLDVDAVLTNNRFGAYIATKHLLDHKHRDIGVIGNINASPSYIERWEGYLLALRDHGIKPNEKHMLIEIPEEEQTISEALQAVEKQPSVWFGLNDGFAFHTCNALKHLGYKIPDDISICGFDNTHYSQMAVPKITTMDIDLSLFARKGLQQLIWRIEHSDEVHQEILLPTRLIERESIASKS